MALKFRNLDQLYLKPDVKFKSLLAAKFINCIMRKGKKSTAERVFYQAMDIIEEKIADKDPMEVFETAINNVKPVIEVRSKRVGGATYQVPMEVPEKRAVALAIRWILTATRQKKGRPMAQRLAAELMDAYNRQGTAMTTRENVHKMAEANKAFAHFAW